MTDRPVALVTGATRGIGAEVARGLAARGHLTLVGARDPDRGEEVVASMGHDAAVVALDVTDAASIAAAAEVIGRWPGRLDVLVNNAGIAPPATWCPPGATPVDELRRTIETNVIGAVAVTNALLPLLRRSPAARVVNVTSGLGAFAVATDPPPWFAAMGVQLAYPVSKAALNMATVLYANELADSTVKVVAVSPGFCATDLNGHEGFLTAAQGAEVIVAAATMGAGGPTGVFVDAEGPHPW